MWKTTITGPACALLGIKGNPTKKRAVGQRLPKPEYTSATASSPTALYRWAQPAAAFQLL
jgi:hypothetical protein